MSACCHDCVTRQKIVKRIIYQVNLWAVHVRPRLGCLGLAKPGEGKDFQRELKVRGQWSVYTTGVGAPRPLPRYDLQYSEGAGLRPCGCSPPNRVRSAAG